MKTGLIISGATHLALFLVAMLNLSFFNVEPKEVPQVTEVSILTEEEFAQSLQQDAPDLMTDMSAMFQPTAEANDAERPDDAIAPEQTEMDVTEAPSERDSDADLSAVLIPVADPDVEVNAVVIAAPTFEAPPSPTMGLGTEGNTAVPTFGASSAPRSAPRIDAFAAPALPNFSTTSDRTVEEATPDENVPDPVEEQPAESQPDSVAEILPEAQPDGSDSAAPPRASTPPRRSNRIAEIQEAIERADNPVEEPEIVEAVDGAVDDLLAGLEEDAPESPTTIKLTQAQQRSISSAVGTALERTWNLINIRAKPNFERLIVRVEVILNADGTIVEGSVRPIEPSNPQGDFEDAYRAARSAILQLGRFDIPAADIPEGIKLTLVFDPSKDLAGLN